MQKTAYVMRVSDWSSDVCSSDRQRRRYAFSAFAGCQAGGGRDHVAQRDLGDRKRSSVAIDVATAIDQRWHPARADRHAGDAITPGPPEAVGDRKSTRLNSSH